MTAAQETAVTYTGKETPFVDRIYRSRLTFNPGQTRALPALLAAKLLRHSDVFKLYVEPAPEQAPSPAPAAVTPTSAATEGDKAQTQQPSDSATVLQVPPPVETALDPKPVIEDDTAKLLDEAKKAEDQQRQQEDARFTLLQQIDKMDKQALRDWTKQTYNQDMPPQLGLEKMRDRVRGFIDQFGAL